MKAILIARVSTEEQKEAGNSLPAQIARLERYCQNPPAPTGLRWTRPKADVILFLFFHLIEA